MSLGFKLFKISEFSARFIIVLISLIPLGLLIALVKGIPGFMVPFLAVSVVSIVFKTTRESLKYSIYSVLFFIIVLPWHIIMLKTYGEAFFSEYIIKHHILRFLGSDVIHRNEP